MAVNLTRLWLNDAADPSDALSLLLGPYTPTDAVQLAVRRYASGRFRAIRSPGRKRTAKAVVRHPVAEDRAWLDEHLGRLVCVRDPDGRKWYAVYTQFERDRPPSPLPADITLSLTSVTHSEAV